MIIYKIKVFNESCSCLTIDFKKTDRITCETTTYSFITLLIENIEITRSMNIKKYSRQ